MDAFRFPCPWCTLSRQRRSERIADFCLRNCVLCSSPISKMSQSPTPSLSQLISARADQMVTFSQLVTLLERVKEDILLDAQEKSDLLHRQVKDEMSTLSALSNRILATVCTSTLESRSSRSRGSSSRKRSEDPPPSVNTDKSDLFANPEIGATEHLKLLMLFTVMAFVAKFRNAEKWVALQTHQRMHKFMPLLKQVSGFSLILFDSAEYRCEGYSLADCNGTSTITACAMDAGPKSVSNKGRYCQCAGDRWSPSKCTRLASAIWECSIYKQKKWQTYLTYWTGQKTEGYLKNACAPSSLVSEVPGLIISHHDRRPRKRRRQAEEIEADPILKAQMYAVPDTVARENRSAKEVIHKPPLRSRTYMELWKPRRSKTVRLCDLFRAWTRKWWFVTSHWPWHAS